MKEKMGYRNAERVYALAARGLLGTKRDGKPRLNDRALNVLMFMALKSASKEDSKVVRGTAPYWCYWGGWNELITATGMAAASADSTAEELLSEESLSEAAVRRRTAMNKISITATFLQKNGVIKKLRPANKMAGSNTIWLLLLGTEEENEEAERRARQYFGLPMAIKEQ